MKYRMSLDPKGAEESRLRSVPQYGSCQFSKAIRGLYDHAREDAPSFVDCIHPVFKRENGGECLGQCTFLGQKYGQTHQ